MKKDIVFLLPGSWAVPIGGYKIIYEYANRFADDNFNVFIIYPAQVCFAKHTVKSQIYILFQYVRNLLFHRYKPYAWFPLDKRIRLKYVWSLSEDRVPSADIYVATAVETALYLNSYRTTASKFYFIQGYENWSVEENCLHETYRFNFKKIVIAPWLLEKIQSVGENATLIYNGFDFEYFKKSIDAKDKNKYSITMLYHTSKLKGCEDAIAALNIVKKKYSNLSVNLFGFPAAPSDLPDWFNYYQNPNKEVHNRIYNESAIFIGASYTEGFSLTPAEAMMCGCAVACTDIGGYQVVCIDEETALLSPVANPELLAKNIIRLIDNDDLRLRIAHKGYDYIHQFTWKKSFSLLKQVICELS